MTQASKAAGRSLDPRWLAFLAIANVLPIMVSGPLPFSDGPEHVAVIATFRHWFDPAWHVAATYVFDPIRSQYWLYHAAGALFALVLPDAEVANRWLLAASGIALPYALRELLRALRRDERLAIFAGPLFWNRALGLGLFPYIACMPLLLYGLSLAARQAESPRRARAAGLALLSLASFYVHVVAFALLALSAAVEYVLGRVRAARENEAKPPVPWWLLPGALAAAVWLALGSIALHGESVAGGGEVGRIGLLRTAYGLELWSHDIWTSHWDELCAVLYWMAFAWIGLGRLRPGRVREGHPDLRVYVPFACALVLYFVAPYRLGAAITLNVRMAPLVALLAVPLLDPGDAPGGRWALALASVAALLVPIVNGYEIRRIDIEEAVEPEALFAKAQPGARLAALNFHTKSPRTHFAPWPHLGAYYRLRGGGVASWSFSEMHHWSLHYAPAAAPPSHGPFWEFNPCVFRNAVDGPYYDYVLVRGHVDPFKDEPPGPVWRAIAHQRDYTLYEKAGGEWPARDVGYEDPGPCKAANLP